VSPRLPSRRKILIDIGCGNGAQTALLAGDFERTLGVDVAIEYVKTFRENVQGEGSANALIYNGTRFPICDEVADCVTCFAVLEHAADEVAILAEIKRILRRDGLLMISVPHRWWIFETHGANLPLLRWNRIPLVSWWPRWLHDRYARARIYRRRDIIELLEGNGFTIGRVSLLTAPLDVLRWRALRAALRRSVFRHDETRVPFLGVEVMVVAQPN